MEREERVSEQETEKTRKLIATRVNVLNVLANVWDMLQFC